MYDKMKGTNFERYVAHPEKGSMHNYGIAVDITIVDERGEDLDMGITPFKKNIIQKIGINPKQLDFTVHDPKVHAKGYHKKLSFSNLILGLIIGFSLQLDGWSTSAVMQGLETYFITTIQIILLNTPIAFFALWGKGYLAPLGIVAILLVLAQIMGAMGMGIYFPWSVPGIYSGGGGEELKMQLNEMSFTILIITSIAGYIGTITWWKFSDQK